MIPQRENESITGPTHKLRRMIRSGLPGMFAVLLLTSWLVGAGTISDVSANIFDVAKIVAVVAFIAAMVALAMSMLGDSDPS